MDTVSNIAFKESINPDILMPDVPVPRASSHRNRSVLQLKNKARLQRRESSSQFPLGTTDLRATTFKANNQDFPVVSLEVCKPLAADYSCTTLLKVSDSVLPGSLVRNMERVSQHDALREVQASGSVSQFFNTSKAAELDNTVSTGHVIQLDHCYDSVSNLKANKRESPFVSPLVCPPTIMNDSLAYAISDSTNTSLVSSLGPITPHFIYTAPLVQVHSNTGVAPSSDISASPSVTLMDTIMDTNFTIEDSIKAISDDYSKRQKISAPPTNAEQVATGLYQLPLHK